MGGNKKKEMKSLKKQKKQYFLGDLVLVSHRNKVKPGRVEHVDKPEGEIVDGDLFALYTYHVHIYGPTEIMLVGLFINRKSKFYDEYI